MRGVLASLQIRNLTSPAQISVRKQCPTSARKLRCTLAKCPQEGPSRAGHLARRRLAPHDVGQCLASFLILANTRAPRITRMFILDALGGERHRHLVQRMAWNLLLGDLVCALLLLARLGTAPPCHMLPTHEKTPWTFVRRQASRRLVICWQRLQVRR